MPFPASWSCDCGTLDIEQLLTFWPPEDERVDIAKALEADWDVPGGCIDIIDGFHVVVAYRSRRLRLLQTQDHYAFDILSICNNMRRIRDLTKCGEVGRQRYLEGFPALQGGRAVI